MDNEENILEIFVGKRVLVVDDDMITQLTTRALLGNCNFEVVLSSSAGDAVSKISKDKFNLVLTDLFMPDMDGFELARRLRELEIRTPIIAFSSDDSKQTHQLCKDAGIDTLLVKKLYTKMEWAQRIYDVVYGHPGFGG